jgi:hypothetical protein
MSILVHADTKVGKSTFAATAPKPMLLLDAEAAYRFLPGKKTFWDPVREEPPKFDGSWEICVVKVLSYNDMVKSFEWLNSGKHEFKSVVIDSISEIQTKCKDDLVSDGRMSIQLWGDLLTHMERLVRGFRDLTEHRTNPIEAVVMTAMTQQREGKWRPYVQGQLQVKMPYFLDVIGYMYVDTVQSSDPTVPATKVRKMLVTPHPQFEAGERVQGRLGDVVENPNIPDMLDSVFGSIKSKEDKA